MPHSITFCPPLTRRHTLYLSHFVTCPTPHIVVYHFFPHDHIHHPQPGINPSGYSGIQYIIGRKIPDHLDSPDSCTYLTDTTLCQDDFLLPQLSGHIAVPPYFLFFFPAQQSFHQAEFPPMATIIPIFIPFNLKRDCIFFPLRW